MKHLILGAVSTAALLLAGSGFAQNVTTINQQGSNNSASADQSNGSNELTQINQISSSNIATVTQGGVNDEAFIDQDTDGAYTASTATVTQIGQNGTFQVAQHGYNAAVATQGANSVGETGYISQTGYNPGVGALLQQNGFGNSGWIIQTGNFNISTVTQNGSGGYAGPLVETAIDGTLNADNFGFRQGGGSQQIGSYNTSIIDQEGSAGMAVTEATGVGNYQNILQGAASNQATAFHIAVGDYNTGEITQAQGPSFSGNTVFGSSNIITVFQNGASTSLIGQGTHVDAVGIGVDEGTPVSYASATVTQTGDGHASTIEQFSSATATVVQISFPETAGDTSKITQGAGAVWSQATVNPYGSAGFSYIDQEGVADVASLTQEQGSGNEGSSIVQTGQSDTASVDQSGNQEASNVAQTGYSNSVTVNQSGYNNGSDIIQTGDWNTATVMQKGAGASSTITQAGSGNSAIVKQ
ncbi:MAG TPA: hypothetical protein VG407_18185 [Caulobacteraceae bacterium]|nr:hypothetical protein [Caulobacteraceae bacterium]